jgi:peptidoglycan hydrolase CwlO-like protein
MPPHSSSLVPQTSVVSNLGSHGTATQLDGASNSHYAGRPVTELSGTSAARIGTAHRWRRWEATVKASLACALVAGAAFSVTLFSFDASSGADQVSSLQAQAAQISSEMLLEQLQIGGYQQQYGAAVEQVQQDTQLIEQTRASIEHDQQRIDRDTNVLRRAAVSAYVDGGTTANVTPLFANQGNDQSRSEYQQVLMGVVSDAVDQLHSDRLSMKVHEASLQRIEAQDTAAEAVAQSTLQQSQSTEQQLQEQSAQVNGQLAVAVAQQQAEQAAAAAAAVAAAQAKAVAVATAQKTAVDVGNQIPTSSASTAIPTLNPFLQCVVQAESSGDYQAVSPNGEYMGAFQFSQATWNEAALLAGQPNLVGVPPNQATPAEQDDLAIALYNADGSQPWYDPCTSG